MKIRKCFLGPLAAPMLALSLMLSTGCSPTDQAYLQTVEQAVNAYAQNKGLAEQFVRDAKTKFTPDEPQYQRIQAAYEKARDRYNDYLSGVRASVKSGRAELPAPDSIADLNQTTTDFVSTATRTIDPTAGRGIKFDDAIKFPHLEPSAVRLSSDARKLFADRTMPDLRWRTWSDIQ